jgi:hypothetical protein
MKTTRAVAVPLLLLALAAGEASAREPTFVGRPKHEIGFDLGVGTMAAGGRELPGGGLAVRWGRRYDRLLLRGDAGLYFVEPASGEAEGHNRATIGRAGVAARWSFLTLGSRSFLGGDFWIEAGLGWQEVAWTDGVRDGYRDLELGVGAQIDMRIGAETSPSKVFSGYLSLRVIKPAGPEDGPVGTLFSVGYIWGR